VAPSRELSHPNGWPTKRDQPVRSRRRGMVRPLVLAAWLLATTGDMWAPALAAVLVKDHTVDRARSARHGAIRASRFGFIPRRNQALDHRRRPWTALKVQKADLVTHDNRQTWWGMRWRRKYPSRINYTLGGDRCTAPGNRQLGQTSSAARFLVALQLSPVPDEERLVQGRERIYPRSLSGMSSRADPKGNR